jgi:hypothetical protein
VLGVVQVWLQPYVSVENYREFAQFLTQLSSYVEGHFQSRRLGTWWSRRSASSIC